jgi:hypothetical protein
VGLADDALHLATTHTALGQNKAVSGISRFVHLTNNVLEESQEATAYYLLRSVQQSSNGLFTNSDEDLQRMSKQVVNITNIASFILQLGDGLKNIRELQNTINVNSFLNQAGYGSRSTLVPELKQLLEIGHQLHDAYGISPDVIRLLGIGPSSPTK